MMVLLRKIFYVHTTWRTIGFVPLKCATQEKPDRITYVGYRIKQNVLLSLFNIY